MNQQYKNWIAIIVGPSEAGKDERFVFLEHDLVPKAEKVGLAIEYLKRHSTGCDYIIRFDDDDIISNRILEQYQSITVDCLYDAYHSFIEVGTKRTGQQKRPWLANTVIHKFEHAIAEIQQEGTTRYLLCQDHSKAWHLYYKNRDTRACDPDTPIYLRVLSPVSITSKAATSMGNIRDEYTNYLLAFGSWNKRPGQMKGFERSIIQLKEKVNDLGQFDLFNVKWPFWRLMRNRLLDYKLNLD